MRGNTLGALIQMLRRELKIAESPALGKNTREAHAHALRSAQERLYTAKDWPFKNIYRDIAGAAGQRYYGLPSNMRLEDIREAKVKVGNQWLDLDRGISTEQFNAVNSDADVRQDYIRRWDNYNDPTTNLDMLEAWPIPTTNAASTMRFFGVRSLSALVADADKADLDDLAIVLTAAADLAAPKDQKKAEAKANAHVFNLLKNLSDDRTFVSGGGNDPNDARFRPPQIVISQ